MRLIDADAMYKSAEDSFGAFPGGFPLLYVLKEILDNEQTVDPVVHARWLNHIYPVCSHCGFEDKSLYEHGYDFCPSCGAKMNEDKPFSFCCARRQHSSSLCFSCRSFP